MQVKSLGVSHPSKASQGRQHGILRSVEGSPAVRQHVGVHVQPRGSEALVNDFEKTCQENYDAAEAKAAQDRERRRQNARQPHAIVDSPLEEAQNINRAPVSDATERRAASAAVSSAGGIHTTLLPLLLLH